MKTSAVTAALAAALSVSAIAEPPRLGEYLERETQAITRTLDDNDPGEISPGERWFFRRFTIRVRPRVVFTAGVAKIGIIPDLEILLDRELPEGWVPYHPQSSQ